MNLPIVTSIVCKDCGGEDEHHASGCAAQVAIVERLRSYLPELRKSRTALSISSYDLRAVFDALDVARSERDEAGEAARKMHVALEDANARCERADKVLADAAPREAIAHQMQEERDAAKRDSDMVRMRNAALVTQFDRIAMAAGLPATGTGHAAEAILAALDAAKHTPTPLTDVITRCPECDEPTRVECSSCSWRDPLTLRTLAPTPAAAATGLHEFIALVADPAVVHPLRWCARAPCMGWCRDAGHSP